TFNRTGDRVHQSILSQSQSCEAVVAAIPVHKRRGQGQVFHAGDASNPAFQRRRRKIIGAQATASAAQRFELRRESVAERGGRAACRDGERFDPFRHPASLVAGGSVYVPSLSSGCAGTLAGAARLPRSQGGNTCCARVSRNG